MNTNEILGVNRQGIVPVVVTNPNNLWTMRLTEDLQLTKLTPVLQRDLSAEGHTMKQYGKRVIIPDRGELDGEFVALERQVIMKGEFVHEAYIRGVKVDARFVLRQGMDAQQYEQELLALIHKYFDKVGIVRMEMFEELPHY